MSTSSTTTGSLAAVAARAESVGLGELGHPSHARLAPIENPEGLRLRFAYWAMRKWMGKVLTPAKIMYARVPEAIGLVTALGKFQSKGMTLEPSLQLLIGDWTSQINGCTFCEDIGRAAAVQKHLGLEEKFDALPNYRTDPRFTARERAALAYAEEATRNKRVSDATFEALRAQFTERQIVEITLLNAIENMYNLTNLPLGVGSDGLCAIAQKGAARARAG